MNDAARLTLLLFATALVGCTSSRPVESDEVPALVRVSANSAQTPLVAPAAPVVAKRAPRVAAKPAPRVAAKPARVTKKQERFKPSTISASAAPRYVALGFSWTPDWGVGPAKDHRPRGVS